MQKMGQFSGRRLGLAAITTAMTMLVAGCGHTDTLGSADNGTHVTIHLLDKVVVDIGPGNNHTVSSSNPAVLRVDPLPIAYTSPQTFVGESAGDAMLTGSISGCPYPPTIPRCLAPDRYWSVKVTVLPSP